MKIIFGSFFEQVASRVFANDVAVRRHWPAFAQACATVCLIRSFQPDHQQPQDGILVVDFVDFAVTALIFDRIFVQSLHRQEGSTLQVRQAVSKISAHKGHASAKDLADYLTISLDAAYERMRVALKAGVITRSNPPAEDNRKFYVAAPRPRFIPDPEEVFQSLRNGPSTVRFVHPITAEWVIYSRRSAKKSK